MYDIRKMAPSDCNAVHEVESVSFSDAWSLKSFQDLFKYENQYYYVAEKEKNIIGFAGMIQLEDEAEIMNVAVLPEYRGKGVANALMHTIFKEGKKRKIQSYYLEVRKSNAAAIRLYHQNGFKVIASRKNYYKKPVEDALIMKNMASDRR